MVETLTAKYDIRANQLLGQSSARSTFSHTPRPASTKPEHPDNHVGVSTHRLQRHPEVVLLQTKDGADSDNIIVELGRWTAN